MSHRRVVLTAGHAAAILALAACAPLVPAGAAEHTARPGLVRPGLLPHPPVGRNERGKRTGPGRDKADQRGHLDVVGIRD
ncbi:hypothetical protein [Actinomyces sp. ICM47]|uniref:hypothetical protein n=1 Tax=Actinomyces sp. ICM47 TaxID=936548 RepID=UPI0025B8863B|nr:hypothetical protein [Actinomyces sp. ICM47]